MFLPLRQIFGDFGLFLFYFFYLFIKLRIMWQPVDTVLLHSDAFGRPFILCNLFLLGQIQNAYI